MVCHLSHDAGLIYIKTIRKLCLHFLNRQCSLVVIQTWMCGVLDEDSVVEHDFAPCRLYTTSYGGKGSENVPTGSKEMTIALVLSARSKR